MICHCRFMAPPVDIWATLAASVFRVLLSLSGTSDPWVLKGLYLGWHPHMGSPPSSVDPQKSSTEHSSQRCNPPTPHSSRCASPKPRDHLWSASSSSHHKPPSVSPGNPLYALLLHVHLATLVHWVMFSNLSQPAHSLLHMQTPCCHLPACSLSVL